MRARISLAALLLAACAAPAPPLAPQQSANANGGSALAPVAPELAGKLDTLASLLEFQRAELHVPGLAVAIVQDDRLVFARGFGLAEVEGNRPVTPETTFAIGSTTKAFTATLVGMLADEGKLAYDDPVTRYLPWFELPIQGKGPVLVRDLLAHRTGFARMDILWASGKASPDEVLHTALRAEPMAPFRSKFLYNNVMFLAAGEVCAAVGGASWEELVRARILGPLGMDASTTSATEAERDPRLALGYDWDAERERFQRRPMRRLGSIAPAGAINSNVLDLSRWVRFLLARGELEGRRLISAERLEETWKPANTVTPGIDYGLGWMLGKWNGEPTRSHGGNIDGFAASVWLLPGRRTGVALLANVTYTTLQDRIGPMVFETLFGAPTTAGPASAEAELERYTGTFRANFAQFDDAAFRVLVRDGKLAVDIPGQTTFELGAPDEHGKRPFALLPEQIQVSFEEAPAADGSAQVVALRLHQGGLVFECYREGYAPPVEVAPEELAPYLGTYTDPMSGKRFTVVVQRERLAVDYPDQMVYELRQPDAEGRWVFRATDQLAVEFHLDADGRAESLTFHERGTRRECERTGDGPGAPPPLADVLALRRGAEFEARLAELGPCRLHWTLRLVHCGIEGTTTFLFDARGRFRDDTDLAPFATTATTCDGERIVAESSLEPTRELLGKNRDASLASSMLAFFGDWQRRFDEVRVLQALEDGVRKLVAVKLVKGTAPPLRVHVDLATGDIVRAELKELVDGIGGLPKTLTFEGWHERDGLRLPARIVSEDDATGRVVSELVALETGVSDRALERLPELPPAAR